MNINKKNLFIVAGCAIFMLGSFFVFVFISDGRSVESLVVDNESVEDILTQETDVDNTQLQQENRISEEEYFNQIRNDNASTAKENDKKETVEEMKTYKPFDFVVIADSESYKASSGHEEKFESMLVKAASYKPDFAIFSGDLITQGEQDRNRVTNLKGLIKKYYKEYYITFGKHDVECGVQCIDIWESVFFNKKYASGEKRVLYHSFDYENTHFVLLSSDYPIKHAVDDVQLKWLDEDLKDNDKSNVIVVVHVPPVTFFKESVKESHDMTYNVVQRDKLLAILRRYKVDLVVSGHEHAFDHKVVDEIDYVLAGAVGKSKRYKDSIWKDSFLYITVSGGRIKLKSIGLDGELIREIQIK